MTLAVAGCGGDSPAATPDAGIDASVALAPCASNRDCSGGQVCRGDFCRTSCTVGSDCAAPLGTCDPTLSYCVECSTTADCARNESCESNACAFHCVEDSACASDEYCVLTTGACAARECTTTADCSGGFECTHYVCTPIDPIVCDAGTATCSGGNTSVLRCNADGTMEMSETCAMGSRCVVDGMAASCAPVVCTADEVGCTSDFTAFACDSTGTVRTETPCATGFYCGAGVCAAQACTPGATRCSAAGVHEVCDARGAVFEAAPCADTQGCRDGACLDRICTPAAARCVPGSLTGHEVCDAEGLAYVSSPCAGTESCSAGACLARTCVPSVASCDGTTGSHVCNADGLGYSATMSCGAGASCSVATGLCGGWLCTPGTTSCLASSNTRRLCNADGLGYTDTACGASTTCSAGVCAAWTCTPGAFSCADVNTRRVCNADGLGYTSASCAGGATYGYSCTGAGTCTDRACIPGTNGPVCASASARQVCTSDGLGYSTVACAASESCAAGACQTRICTAGAARCVAGTLTGREVCAPDGLSWTATACADTQSCSGAGTCSTRVCTPGAPQCVGTTGTRTCNADGLGYSATTTCTAGTSCSAATGLCGAWLCTPGSTSCVAGTNTRHVCNADGLGYTDTACGASTTCSAGVCAAWTCTPGAFSCADVNTRRVCNADGLGYTSASCAGAATYGYSCTGAGTCTDRVCSPGAASAVCASTTARQVCNTDGLGYSATSCSAGQSCGTGTCAVRCGDGIIGASETCDDGNVVNGDGCSSVCASEACGALSFDGVDDRVSFPTLSLGNTNWTVEAWIWRTTDIDGTGSAVSFGPAGGGFAMVTYWTAGTTYDGYLCVQRGGLWDVCASTRVDSTRWHHLAMTHNTGAGTSTYTFFVDGVLSTAGIVGGAPGAIFPTPAGGNIGAEIGTYNAFFRGLIDEVRISSTVRYTTSFTPAQRFTSDASTLALYEFEERTGTVATDSGPLGYNGTLVGGPTWTTVPSCIH